MSHRSHNKPRKNKLFSLYIWHRYLGLTAAVLVLVLSVTGIMLNHTERFKLDEYYITTNWLLDWYKIKLPNKINTYQASEQWMTQMGHVLYFNEQSLDEEIAQLHGAVGFNGMIVVAVDESILLFMPSGELIEKLDSFHGVPRNLTAIGITNHSLVAVKAHGELYVADEDLLTWVEVDDSKIRVDWVKAVALPESMKSFFSRHYRQNILSREKVVLDLHSGRFFGSNGVLIMDAAAIILCFLAISGSSIWIIQTLKRKRKIRNAKRNILNQ